MDRRSPHPDMTKRGLVVISLICGHQVTTRSAPMSGGTKYGCRAGTGCGYSIMWGSYQNYGSDVRHDNSRAEEIEKAE